MASSHASSKHCAASVVPHMALSRTACPLLHSSSSCGTLITMLRRALLWNCALLMSLNPKTLTSRRLSSGSFHASTEDLSELELLASVGVNSHIFWATNLAPTSRSWVTEKVIDGVARSLVRTANSATCHWRLNSRHLRQSTDVLEVPVPFVMLIFMRKCIALGDLPAMHCHQRLQVTHSSIQDVSKLRVCLVHGLYLHESFALW